MNWLGGLGVFVHTYVKALTWNARLCVGVLGEWVIPFRQLIPSRIQPPCTQHSIILLSCHALSISVHVCEMPHIHTTYVPG